MRSEPVSRSKRVIDWLWREPRQGARSLRRAPIFTLAVILILGVGIGGATTMLTAARMVLVTPLPVQDPDAIAVGWTYRDPSVEYTVRTDDLEPIAAASQTMREIAGVSHWGAQPQPFIERERSLVLNGTMVTPNYFEVLGVRPVLGRMLRPADGDSGAARTLVLSWSAWQSDFHGDSAVIGHHLIEPYDNQEYEVVGVAPPGLDYPRGVEAWLPFTPGVKAAFVVARLRSGVTPAMAGSDLFAVATRLFPDRELRGARMMPLAVAVEGGARPLVIALSAGVTLLLTIACVNVGVLLLLRGARRERELVIRRALGAGRAAVLRHLLTESMILAACGGVLGLCLASWLLRALILAAPSRLPRLDLVSTSGAPIGMSVAITLAALIAFGTVPAMASARLDLAKSLVRDNRTIHGSRSSRRLRHRLVATQMALAVLMVTLAGLLIRSLSRLEHVDLGYKPDHLSIVSIAMPTDVYTAGRLEALGESVVDRWRAVAGVESITPIAIPPLSGSNVWQGRFDRVDQTEAEAASNPAVAFETAGPEYFRTLGIPIVQGRAFTLADGAGAPYVAVVSESVARRFWPGQDPIGKQIKMPGDPRRFDSSRPRTVVGVVADNHLRTLRGLVPAVYIPWHQLPSWQGNVAIRSHVPLRLLASDLRSSLKELDPRLSLWRARTMDELLNQPLAEPKLGAVLMSTLALLALVLAAVGLFGVMASAVAAQTREIGVRLALGAAPSRLRWEVINQALRITFTGGAAGLALAMVATRVLRSVLYEVSPNDPFALGAAAAILLVVAGVAAWIPALRATRVDPAAALRSG